LLSKRINSADRRILEMKEELARREKIARYGTETPELRQFDVVVEATFWLTVQAKDEADATNVVDETDWLVWYDTSPGKGIQVDDYSVEAEAPALLEEDDPAEQMKIEATKQIVSAD
jgi:hypothetical protein